MQFKTYQTHCYILFSLYYCPSYLLFRNKLLQSLSHLKQLLSLGSGDWVGLSDFLMSRQGVSPEARVTSAYLGAQLGLSARIPACSLLPGLGSSQHGGGFKHECPQDTRQRLSGFLWPTPRSSETASVMLKSQACTDLRKESQCHVLTRICVKYCGHLGKYTDFSNHVMKSPHFSWLYQQSIEWNISIVLSILLSDMHNFIFWGISVQWMMKHKLESRLPGDVSISSDKQMTPPVQQKANRN